MVSKLEVGGLGGQPSSIEATIEASGVNPPPGLEPASIANEIVSTTISAATAPSFSKSRDGLKFFSSGARHRPRLFQHASQALANPFASKIIVFGRPSLQIFTASLQPLAKICSLLYVILL